jgi:DNA-binding response OmpR family regulator
MKVLIVDDEPEVLTIVSKWLTKAGHQVLTTGDAEKIPDLIRNSDPDVVCSTSSCYARAASI